MAEAFDDDQFLDAALPSGGGGAPLPPPMAPMMEPLPKPTAPGSAPDWTELAKEKKAGPSEEIFASIAADPDQKLPTGTPPPSIVQKHKMNGSGPLPADDVRAVAEEQLNIMRLTGLLPDSMRTDLLRAIADGLEELLEVLGEDEHRRIVADLLAELRAQGPDAKTLDERWQSTLSVLEALAAPAPARRAFWKR